MILKLDSTLFSWKTLVAGNKTHKPTLLTYLPLYYKFHLSLINKVIRLCVLYI